MTRPRHPTKNVRVISERKWKHTYWKIMLPTNPRRDTRCKCKRTHRKMIWHPGKDTKRQFQNGQKWKHSPKPNNSPKAPGKGDKWTKTMQTHCKIIRSMHPAANTVWETKNESNHLGDKWKEMHANLLQYYPAKPSSKAIFWETNDKKCEPFAKWSGHAIQQSNRLGDK